MSCNLITSRFDSGAHVHAGLVFEEGPRSATPKKRVRLSRSAPISECRPMAGPRLPNPMIGVQFVALAPWNLRLKARIAVFQTAGAGFNSRRFHHRRCCLTAGHRALNSMRVSTHPAAANGARSRIRTDTSDRFERPASPGWAIRANGRPGGIRTHHCLASKASDSYRWSTGPQGREWRRAEESNPNPFGFRAGFQDQLPAT